MYAHHPATHKQPQPKLFTRRSIEMVVATPMEIHVSLFGNRADYVIPLCANLDVTKDMSWVASWVIHLDDSVPTATRQKLVSLNKRVRLVEHPPHAGTFEGPLWRFAALRSTGYDGPTMTWDADNFIYGFVPTIKKFLDDANHDVWYHDPNDGTTELYTFFASKVDAALIMLKPAGRTQAIDAALDAVPKCPPRYIECNQICMHTRPEPWYCWDEFVLTYVVKPLWPRAHRRQVCDIPSLRKHDVVAFLTKIFTIPGMTPVTLPVPRRCAFRPDLVESVLSCCRQPEDH